MNEIMESLYDSIADKCTLDNPFETTEINVLFNVFLKKWFEGLTPEKEQEAQYELLSLRCAIQQTGFQVGFRTAVNLLMSK